MLLLLLLLLHRLSTPKTIPAVRTVSVCSVAATFAKCALRHLCLGVTPSCSSPDPVKARRKASVSQYEARVEQVGNVTVGIVSHYRTINICFKARWRHRDKLLSLDRASVLSNLRHSFAHAVHLCWCPLDRLAAGLLASICVAATLGPVSDRYCAA